MLLHHAQNEEQKIQEYLKISYEFTNYGILYIVSEGILSLNVQKADVLCHPVTRAVSAWH